MHRDHLEAMSVDELWALHTDVRQILAVKLIAAKRDLEERLKQLSQRVDLKEPGIKLLKVRTEPVSVL
ncbi:DNA-binding protein H-NS [Bradyrhizobium sp. CIR48]|uniref:hypothetical protein n=1 Tax=unclassified Bradyrhizobium TaxID=2631580 RepID=UPI0016062564|nr:MULTISPECIES: hypothetical protein [unclassified Bradyrhizobium]MBB4366909.1 DNA-binding protein H-NS [Bradyrhizobium sp. CIR18]MBB4429412.1 DNA-binding protein H-NS [Bradyrhizobium sp. CIR48]